MTGGMKNPEDEKCPHSVRSAGHPRAYFRTDMRKAPSCPGAFVVIGQRRGAGQSVPASSSARMRSIPLSASAMTAATPPVSKSAS